MTGDKSYLQNSLVPGEKQKKSEANMANETAPRTGPDFRIPRPPPPASQKPARPEILVSSILPRAKRQLGPGAPETDE